MVMWGLACLIIFLVDKKFKNAYWNKNLGRWTTVDYNKFPDVDVFGGMQGK